MGQKYSSRHHRSATQGYEDSLYNNSGARKSSDTPVVLPPIATVVDRAADRAKMDRFDAQLSSDPADHWHWTATHTIDDDPVVPFNVAEPAPVQTFPPPPHDTKSWLNPHLRGPASPKDLWSFDTAQGMKPMNTVNPHDTKPVSNTHTARPFRQQNSGPFNPHRSAQPVVSDDTDTLPVLQIYKAPHVPVKDASLPQSQSLPTSLTRPHAQKTGEKTFTDREIKAILAIDPNRVIVVIKKNVYDVTKFVDAHPGGPSVLHRNNGKDITDTFFMMHSPQTEGRLPEFLMGRFVTEEERSPPDAAAAATTDEYAASHALSLDSIRQSLKDDPNRLILILFGDAYDVTPMRNEHPGGLRILLNYNGKECGDIFMRIHGLRAKKLVHQYLMGRLLEADDAPSPLLRFAEPRGNAKSNNGKPTNSRLQSARILEKKMINDVGTLQYFTFSCAKPLRLTPGGYVKLYSDVQRDEWHYYSPFQSEATSFKVCIKLYPNGRTSKFLFEQPEAKEIFYEGPFTPSWELRMDANVTTAKPEDRHILLLAGGTGIAPLYFIAASELEKQTTSVTLVYSVKTPDDLMLVEEINRLAARYIEPMPGQPHNLRLALAFSRLPKDLSPPLAQLEYTSLVRCGTHINASFLTALELPPTQAAVLCGPPAFNDALAEAILKAGTCSMECIHTL